MSDTPSNNGTTPSVAKKSKGQRRSQERGAATRSKKAPGKRPSQGGN